MNDSRTTKVTIRNPLLALYLIYIVFIVNIEWINFITQQIGLELSFGIAEGISASILIVFLYFKRNSFSLKKLKVNAEVIIGAFLILGYGGVMSVYPDTGIDTFNYHLIAQNPRFINYFVEDYGYGNLQAWIFRLADRLFYYFRYFLGFRYGTILNTFILVVCFTQIYSLLDEILREVNGKA